MKPLTEMTLNEIRVALYRHDYGTFLVAEELLRRCEQAEEFRKDVIKTCEELLGKTK